jgi:PAS domain S-box-containing protein
VPRIDSPAPQIDSPAPHDQFAVCVVKTEKDGTGIITTVSHFLTELSGYAEDEMVGQSPAMLIPDKAKVAHRYHRLGFMQHPQVRPMAPKREVTLLQKNGQELRVSIGLTPIAPDIVVARISPIDTGG